MSKHQEGMEKQKYKKRSMWQDSAAQNTHIHQEMSQQIKDAGFYFTGSEIKVKIQNLTCKYRSEKKIVGPSGGSPSTWKYYDKVHGIIGNHKCNAVEELMEDNLDTENCSLDVLEGYEHFCDESFSMQIDSQSSWLDTENANISSCSSQGNNNSRKRTRTNYQQEILEQLRQSKDIMQKDCEERREVDSKMLKLQEDLVELEKRKLDIFEKMVNK